MRWQGLGTRGNVVVATAAAGLAAWLSLALTLAAPAGNAAVLQQVGTPDSWGGALIHATAPAGDTRLYVVERQGTVRIVEGGRPLGPAFLEIENVATDMERGLQSIAFAPDYSTSGLFYVFYTAAGADTLDPGGIAGDIRIVEYRRTAGNPLRADPASARLVLKHVHSAQNHNGGQLAFGPDGLLYASIGDNAERLKAQQLSDLFGTLIRIDPRDPDGPGGPATYAVPPSNPFVAGPAGALPEIYAYGLRNPFRFSFAPDGRLIVADVGEGDFEEISVGGLAGANLGWPNCEGFCAPPNAQFTDPFFAYPHRDADDNRLGCSVIGGHVVRDPSLGPGLSARYLYGDFCARDLRTLNLAAQGGAPAATDLSLPSGGGSLYSFGEDAGGCSYVVASTNLYRVAAAAGAAVPCPPPVPGGPDPGVRPGGPTQLDRSPPRLRVRLAGGKRQRLRRKHVVIARCSERCLLRVSGRLRIAPARKSARPTFIRMRGVRATRSGGRQARLRIGLTRPALKRARRSLAAGNRLRLEVTVRARDQAGNRSRPAKRTARLHR